MDVKKIGIGVVIIAVVIFAAMSIGSGTSSGIPVLTSSPAYYTSCDVSLMNKVLFQPTITSINCKKTTEACNIWFSNNMALGILSDTLNIELAFKDNKYSKTIDVSEKGLLSDTSSNFNIKVCTKEQAGSINLYTKGGNLLESRAVYA